MARHSHWHNIQLTKGKADAKKAGVFSKLAKAVTAAAKDGGGDPSFNFKLRMAIDAAKAVNMPKDNIERAVARGVGGGEGTALEEVVYEGFTPGGVAMLVQCLTDNRNRTVAEVKNIVSKHGGSIGSAGSVMWMFEKKGTASFLHAEALGDRELFELTAIESGADSILDIEGGVQLTCDPKDLKQMLESLAGRGVPNPDGAAIEFVAKNTMKVEDETIETQIRELVEALEDNDDVEAVFTNEV